jgi:hypothetical protein
MTKPISKEVRIYLAFWRKAQTEGLELEFKPPTLQAAVAFRMAMYRAIRPYRYGELYDSVLNEAADKWTLWMGKDSFKVKLKHRATLSVAEQFLVDLEMSEDDLLLPHEIEQRGRLLGVQKAIDDDKPEENPFYSREA